MYANNPFKKNSPIGGPPTFDEAAQDYADHALEVPSQAMPAEKTGRTTQTQRTAIAQPKPPGKEARSQSIGAPATRPSQGAAIENHPMLDTSRFKVEFDLACRCGVFLLLFAVGYLSRYSLAPSVYKWVEFSTNSYLICSVGLAWFLTSLHKTRGSVLRMRAGETSIHEVFSGLNSMGVPVTLIIAYSFVTALFGG